MALHARVTRVARTCYARYTFVFYPLHVRVTVSGMRRFRIYWHSFNQKRIVMLRTITKSVITFLVINKG